MTGFVLDLPELWVFSPSITGIILMQLTYGPEARRDFWHRVIDLKRISVGWYLLMILLVPGLLASSILLDVWLGGSFPEMPFLKRIAANPMLILFVVLEVLFRGALSEELGWRGFALDTGIQRWGPRRSGFVIGVIWWAWHLPLFSWPTYGSIHYQWGWFTIMFWSFLIVTILLSLLMTWAYLNNRASILTAILIHFFFNLILGLVLPVTDRVFFFFTIFLALAVILILRRRQVALPAEVSPWANQLAK